jgi:hypothetical protein
MSSLTDRPGGIPESARHRQRLIERHTTRGVDESIVSEHLDRIIRRLAGARIRGYLPILVKRALDAQLGSA